MKDKNKKSSTGENLHENHRQRVKNRFIITKDLDVFADHEVLEMLLFYAIPRQNVNEMAHKILNEFGNLHKVFEANPKEIQSRCGVTENVAVLFSMMSPLFRRYQRDKLRKRVQFNNTEAIAKYIKTAYIGRKNETFMLMCLDKSRSLLSMDVMEEGTLDVVEIYPRKIIRHAVDHGASYLVLAHNHPSGHMKVSDSDRTSTFAMMKYLKTLNIEILDHIIIVNDDYISLQENGDMKDLNARLNNEI